MTSNSGARGSITLGENYEGVPVAKINIEAIPNATLSVHQLGNKECKIMGLSRFRVIYNGVEWRQVNTYASLYREGTELELIDHKDILNWQEGDNSGKRMQWTRTFAFDPLTDDSLLREVVRMRLDKKLKKILRPKNGRCVIS